MRRHPFDALSFVFGVAFVALAGVMSTEAVDITSPGLRWISAIGLLMLGGMLLVGARPGRDERR